MFNPILEAFKNIFKEKRLFFSSFLSLIVVFILLDTFIFGIFNLNNFKAKMESSNQGIVYIKTMTDEEINSFQGKLLKVNGIQTVKYSSKEEAMKVLEKELNVDLSEEENPLQDSFYIYINKDVDANKLKEDLARISEIEEIDLRTEEINKLNSFNRKLDKVIVYGGTASLVFAVILLLNITSFSVRVRRNEIRNLVASGVNGLMIKFTFFIESLILVVLSSLIGFYAFYRLQLFVVEGFNAINLKILGISTVKESMELYLFTLALGVVIILFSNFIGLHGYYRKGKNKEEKKSEESNETIVIEGNLESEKENKE